MVKKEIIKLKEKLDLVSNILDGDILISLKRSNKGIFDSNSTKVYIKDKSLFKQIGLIQNLELSADSENNIVNVTITFPEHPKLSVTVKNCIREYSSALKKLGVKINKKRVSDK
jgi:hypothetical protein